MRYIHRIVLLLTAVACAVLFAGCKKHKSFSGDDMAAYLEKCYGVSFKLITEPDGELNGPGETDYYQLESEDGTKVSVQREKWQGMFSGHYNYTDDYLLQRLYERPELYAELTDSMLNWEKSEKGFTITPRSFSEVAPAVELACNIVNRCGGEITIPTYRESDAEFFHTVPGIYIYGTDDNAGSGLYGGGVNCSGIVDAGDYDSEEVKFFLEQAYVDNVRSGKINEILPDEVLEKYPPEEFKVTSKLVLSRLDADVNVHLVFDRNETVYYCKDSCCTREQVDGGYKALPVNLENIAKWAKAGG